jgi:hypothetical protein
MLTICSSSFEKSKSFSHFSLGFFVLLLLSILSSLHFLNNRHLSDLSLFTLLFPYLCRSCSLDKVSLVYFCSCCLSHQTQEISAQRKSWDFSVLISSSISIVQGLTFKSLMNFELILA